jgi:Leucine-rich repeat
VRFQATKSPLLRTWASPWYVLCICTNGIVVAWPVRRRYARLFPCCRQDLYDSIDFSDNALQRLDNFPLMASLRTILANNNMIARVGDDIASKLPKLELLVLTNNKISSLGELDALSKCTHLRELSLLFNPVMKRQHYRLYVIHKIPSLRVLDFTRVKERVRVCVLRSVHWFCVSMIVSW